MIIKRDRYLDEIKLRMHNGLIKVITGIRRSGKSFLLFHIFRNFLLESGVEPSHIITLELDLYENRKYTDPDEILSYIKSEIRDGGMYYILLDEVQMLSEFEAVLNSLLHIENTDIYVTGSNSRFLSRDIITEFRGRRYIGTPLKYYFEDVGLRNARLGFRQTEENHLMENIIYNELKIRRFQVDAGVVEVRPSATSQKRSRRQLEVDFIANRGSRRYYIQSAFSLPDEEKIRQEKATLVNIPDSFKKIIVVKDVMNVKRDEDGITTMSIYDFLLNKDSLEL